MDCLAVLLDPATKAFAKWLLEDDNLLEATTSLLKEKHLKAYKAVKSKGNGNVVVKPRQSRRRREWWILEDGVWYKDPFVTALRSIVKIRETQNHIPELWKT